MSSLRWVLDLDPDVVAVLSLVSLDSSVGVLPEQLGALLLGLLFLHDGLDGADEHFEGVYSLNRLEHLLVLLADIEVQLRPAECLYIFSQSRFFGVQVCRVVVEPQPLPGDVVGMRGTLFDQDIAEDQVLKLSRRLVLWLRIKELGESL